MAVPFCLPGERVLARVYRSDPASRTSHADLVKVVRGHSTERDDSLVQCKYFTTCGGCQVPSARRLSSLMHRQYQMLAYDRQLELKRLVVERAYRHFSGTSPRRSLGLRRQASTRRWCRWSIRRCRRRCSTAIGPSSRRTSIRPARTPKWPSASSRKGDGTSSTSRCAGALRSD